MMAGKVDIATTMIDPNPAPGWRCCNIDMYWTGNVFYRFIFLDLPDYLKGKLLSLREQCQKTHNKNNDSKKLTTHNVKLVSLASDRSFLLNS